MAEHTKTIHFVGVGGVGMSGIARIAADFGMKVSGSDMASSAYTKQLEDMGIKVFVGHDAANVPENCDVVVASTAIPDTNPEIVAARERGIEVWQRAHMLAELGRGLKTLAAAGTHGKTTTSSMLATAIDALGLDPTFVVGGMVDAYKTNAKSGTGEYYVVEADESDGSFLNLSPYVALVTNVEPDHLDHYTGGIDEIRDTFAKFMSSVPDEGACVVFGDDPELVRIARASAKRVYTYGLGEGNDIVVSGYSTKGISSTFDLSMPDGSNVTCTLKKNPGLHNALNAAGILGVVFALGLDVAAAAEGIADYTGVRRRFDLVGEAAGVTVVDDYAHHPTEIKATLSAAAGLDFKRVFALFQPHRYSRTASLTDEFGKAFADADVLRIMDVYPAGEAPIEGVSGKLIADAVEAFGAPTDVAYLPDKDEAAARVLEELQPGDILFTMGAGDVTKLGPAIVEELKRREEA
ncbi:UDP-N-acetylmuramate--L-alanine ligase [Slackia heliotrinireducens]|uniref:UDP-N-acetylmuramate--L-alanine ligase n=1 Tax=Slackia heliotrinireducens (strain ATCC 29202 / DSM 20476 / NCTC 11029 / RHS 1) TaxID=471855 RepID=C7N4U8_SLAHD|nr:UDP-N-acetylmuramate--L-alanine ligase [Slackia heliotrinireducens]ACV21933.1 UDP-N-acetylmuramate--alanine ligase [Slackia heliotrinireducens DSM 20476]VEG99764.1 UDP-N-acetylmuramate--L-alanine ligase [Slackia heliotrinireducens]